MMMSGGRGMLEGFLNWFAAFRFRSNLLMGHADTPLSDQSD